jgi:broad specificity phosphatase PhoE
VTEARPPIYFVRHGETDWNKQGLIHGKGHDQARAVAGALAAIPGLASAFKFIVSPLQRARQTMGHIAHRLSLPGGRIGVAPEVKELGFGVWEGKPFWELKASPVYPADPETRYSWRPDGGESYADGHSRIGAWIGTVNAPTVVVAHGAIGRCLIGLLGRLNAADLVSLRTPQGCYCRLQDGQIDWFDANSDAA